MTATNAALAFARAYIHCRLRSERAASLVEYALLLAFIAVVCVAAVTTFGQSTTKPYSNASAGFGS